MTIEELRAGVLYEVGVDINCRYTQRYDLPTLVRHAFADICIYEFLRGFLDFEGLGRAARLRVEQFVEDYRSDPGLTRLGISDDLDSAISVAAVPDESSRESSRRLLVDFLTWYGMDPELADIHAGAIEAQVLAAVTDRKEEPAASA